MVGPTHHLQLWAEGTLGTWRDLVALLELEARTGPWGRQGRSHRSGRSVCLSWTARGRAVGILGERETDALQPPDCSRAWESRLWRRWGQTVRV